MRYKCIKEMWLPKCDDDGFEIPNDFGLVTVGSIWERDDRKSFIGGDVHLDSLNVDSELGWIEISFERLKENFMLAEYGDNGSRSGNQWIPADHPPRNNHYILISFENFSVPQVGRYEEVKEGGAFYVGDEEESCISQDLIVNAWMPLPVPYREDIGEVPGSAQSTEEKEGIVKDAKMAADIKQAIEYFEDELSQIKVFAGIVSFQEKERKSIETALKVLRNALEESPEGQQDGLCATSHG